MSTQRYIPPIPARSLVALLLCAAPPSIAHADIDEAKLPPASSAQVDFDRDIQPLFERSCLKCHGPERPKGRFRLDAREAALKGGENGAAIVVGQSAKSPIVHYVAGLVPDMEMPPKGKAEPLSKEEIALLRAWIDQGAVWGQTQSNVPTVLVATPSFGWTGVHGRESVFREHYWRPEGWNGGAEKFEITQRLDPETHLYLEGRALREDYRLSLEIRRRDLGFTRFGFQQYRKYFSDVGGFYPEFTPPAYSLDRDLHLDMGKAWFDLGLTLPDWPQIVLGYEYLYQNGEKSTLQWGSVAQGLELNGDPRARNIYPAFKYLDEKVHVIKLDLDHDITGYHFADRFRGEFHDLNTSRTNVVFAPAIDAFSSTKVKEGYRHFQGANSLTVEKSFKDWLYGSGGYHYSKLQADASFSQDPIFLTGVSIPLVVEQLRSSPIILGRESHIFNFNGLVGPWEGLSFSAGVQSEWTRQTGVGNGEQQFVFTSPGSSPLTNAFRMDANTDTAAVQESLLLRFTRIPFTVLFAEARLEQESIGQYEAQVGGIRDFLRQTDASSDVRDFRGGFTASPWQRLSFSSHYRRYERMNQYQHNTDLAFNSPSEGYSAFIRSRDTYSDEVEAKVVWHAASWLKATFKYQLLSSDMITDTDPVSGDISPGGRIFAGNYDAHVFSLGGILTPWRRVYLSSTFSLQDARTLTAANNSPSIAPYEGQVYSLLNSATFVLTPRTDLFATYNFSLADFSQKNVAAGLPLGVNYQQHALQAGISRKLLQNLITRLQYGLFLYDDPGLGHATDYTAHAVFGSLTMQFP